MSVSWNWHKWPLLLLGLVLSARPIGGDYSSITEKFGAEAVARCNEDCPFQNRTGDGSFDLTCGADCSVAQCTIGCALWRLGLENSCQTSCNVTSETVISRELYCVIGCNEALNNYFQKIKELIGTPHAPALVADSLTPTSLSLVWEAPFVANLSYLLQWRYEELPGSWQYYSNGSQIDLSIINVWNLRPYTKYRFRVAMFLSGRGPSDAIYSAHSVVISTLESGRPTSAPAAVRAAAPDPGRVAISWEPGPFPNGPLIGYVLRLADTEPNVYAALKDMPASNNTFFYMFQNLAPARRYEVSVTMRNSAGEGPRAALTVHTPPLPTSVPQQPILILGGEKNILAAPANDMFSDPVELYTTEANITGVALDVTSDHLFVSVSNGFVYRSSLSHKSLSTAILTPDSIPYKPHDLSVDWLNGHLYILGQVFYVKDGSVDEVVSKWEILRCDFDGRNQLVALSGFSSRPIHFEVDPYNGYLFFALRGVERGGLYRLDLANISNGVRHETPPQQIVPDSHLGAFTVDHADFRILVAHLRRNNILAVSLNGRESVDFRSNTQTPMFKSVRSIAYANGLFYWTNGNEMLTEEYHAQSDSFFHNEYPLFFNTSKTVTRQVLVNLRSCQPIPVPVNPPIGVQAVMGIDRAMIAWSPPHLLGHQGAGAWQRWGYRLQVTLLASGHTVDVDGINGTTFAVENLKEDSEYSIRVAAVTDSGTGPWSSEFVGRTLPETPSSRQSTLLWSGADGLLQSDLMGGNVQTLIHSSHLRNVQITGVSWYRDQLYLVTNASVLWFNTTTMAKGTMANMDNVGSLAVDWIGKRLYWSNPKQQLITRANLDGSNREPVPIVTVAKELAIDSRAAWMYWSTGHAVEAARLSGENKMVYYPAQLFSGKQVMGLTTDLEEKYLYWLVRSYDGSELHRAPAAGARDAAQVSDTLVRRLAGAALGPLCHPPGRLAWSAAGRAVLADPRARHTAALAPRARVLAARDPTLHDGCESLVAIPAAPDAASVAVRGAWDRFTVSWAARRVTVPGARVLYDVTVALPAHTVKQTVPHPWVNITTGSPPHSRAAVSVSARSAWGASAAARAVRATPSAPPAAPHRAALYVQHTPTPTATFRWRPPRQPNGILLGYEAQWWTQATKPSPVALGAERTELVLELVGGSRYYFKVRAYTEAGYGPYSDTVSTAADEVSPIPKVMVSSHDALTVLDLDSGAAAPVPKSTGTPVDFAVVARESVVYWANSMEEIFSSRINGSGHYKLTSINGSAASLAADWVSRSVYWSQLELAPAPTHAVYRADAGRPRARVTRLLTTRGAVRALGVVPSRRALYWYEEGANPDEGTLMTASVNGSDVTPFFNSSRRAGRACNCSSEHLVSRSFVVDLTAPAHVMYWANIATNQILAADMDGCICRVVVDATDNKKYGFMPTSMTVDSKYLYWFNSTERIVFYTTKSRRGKIEQVKSAPGFKIVGLDPASQPYPPTHCLYPKQTEFAPKVLASSTNSISLGMPETQRRDGCSEFIYEMCLTEYTIYYKLGNDEAACDKDKCQFVSTSSQEVVLNDLKPLSNYSVTVEVTNYYASLDGVKPLVGVTVVLQTAAEAPSPARNVTATVLSPELARVQWAAAAGALHELHWRTDDSALGDNYKEHNTYLVHTSSAPMRRLAPATWYTVWVRSRAAARGPHADSAPLRVRTFALPAPPVCAEARAAEILVRGDAAGYYDYKIEYTGASQPPPAEWAACARVNATHWAAGGLRPRTRYRFRLRLVYVASAPPYYWPSDDRFVFETEDDVPGAPGEVRVEAVAERVFRARWSPPAPAGSPVDLYRLWGRPRLREEAAAAAELPADVDAVLRARARREGWQLLHNGTENYWLVDSPSAHGYYVWAQAHNARGWGALGPRGELSAAPRPAPAALLASAAVGAALLLAVAAQRLYVHRRRGKKQAGLAAPRGPDVELATLRQLPTSHAANVIYNQSGGPVDVSALPHIRREQISLRRFLGAGAFGEVFEGTARFSGGEEKVAVKTLRKGASEQEKGEFLQEAALMANFRHAHLLALRGVCLDNDPRYIVMELMEGGDLLSYLRKKRAELYTPSSLTLRDLLSMCADVTRGCRYLETMHYVHRDLACRNCLVAEGPGGRTVKIGDFGLARDIYKNDYYRKEGEGLLPVRWMAVECLVDGVFSCQSDVWAWGVLCGEVLSLGQQPYPARTNRQVLAYVRAGGTPERPPNCPGAFYELLQKCWSYRPEARPTFKECLEVVTSLRERTSARVSLTSAAAAGAQYLTLLGDDAVENRTYLLDENDNAFIDEDDTQMEPSRLLPSHPNTKYLELMCSDTLGDGYELPRAPGSRHSVVGAPARLVRPPLYRTHSLRTSRPNNATIVPLRNGLVKRASLCEEALACTSTETADKDSKTCF